MQDSTFQTFSVPGASTAATIPLTIARGPSDSAVRVVVKNVGAVPIFLAGASADAVSPEGPSSNTFQLDPALSEVFVLAARQLMYAVGSVPGGRVSVHVSGEFRRL